MGPSGAHFGRKSVAAPWPLSCVHVSSIRCYNDRMRSIAVLALLFLAACANWRGIPESWYGRPLDDLVKNWGPPGASHDFADGRRMIAYGDQHQVSGFNPYAPYQTAVYECTVTFTVDEAGIIVSSEVQGNLGGCNYLFRNKAPAP